MIKTVADFLEEFKSKSLNKIQLEDSDITHTTSMGDIFEGLTAEILNYSIFDKLNLKIVNNSFIYNDSGKLSSEMDCMIVIGEGKEINFTKRYKYHVDKVIAVLQVKKTLKGKTLMDAHDNLLSSITINELTSNELYLGRLHKHAYESLVGKGLPDIDKLDELSDTDTIVYHLLKMQAFYPLRIIIGYYGYKNEYTFREGVIKQIEQRIATNGNNVGLNPVRLPDLIICGNNSIVKCAGMPFGAPFLKNEFYWPLLASANDKPIYYLLEFIWTRLSYMFKISSKIFGDDFDIDTVHPLLLAKDRRLAEDSWEWAYMYNELTHEQLVQNPLIAKLWEPTKINKAEYSILHSLLQYYTLEIDNDMLKIFNDNEEELNISLNYLNQSRILSIEKRMIRLLLEEPVIIFNNGNAYIGENKSGEMTAWTSKQVSSDKS